jgi:hypothetical protein
MAMRKTCCHLRHLNLPVMRGYLQRSYTDHPRWLKATLLLLLRSQQALHWHLAAWHMHLHHSPRHHVHHWLSRGGSMWRPHLDGPKMMANWKHAWMSWNHPWHHYRR